MSVALPLEPSVAVTRSGFRPERIAGLAGLIFAVIVGAVNVTIGSMAPPAADASAADIISFMTDNRTALMGVAAVIPFAIVALFLFISSVFSRLSSASPEAAFWTRVATVGVVLVEVMFLSRMTFEFVLIANADALAQEPALVTTLWQLSNAVMIINGLALTITLLGLSRAASLAELIPRWQELLGLGAATLFLVGSVLLVPTLEGSPAWALGLAGFVGWVIFLAITSVRLLLADRDAQV